MSDYKISRFLKEYRINKQLSQEEMGELLHVSRQVYARYENGSALPDLDTACRIASLLGVSVDYLLLGGEEARKKAFQSLPGDFQLLCETYRELNLQNTTNLEFMQRFLKFMKAEEEREKKEKRPAPRKRDSRGGNEGISAD